MSNGQDDIIIVGHKANGSNGSQYYVPLASAQAALAILQAHPGSDSAFITALQDAISFVTG